MKYVTSKRILNAIGCQYLKLYRVGPVGGGYWYFEYDDRTTRGYDTLTILVPNLNMMALERWVEDGKAFVAQMEKTK